MATLAEISEFIKTIRSAPKIFIEPASKNRETRFRLGMTVRDQMNLIRELQIEDYVFGPQPDHDLSRSQLVWIFKKNAFGEVFYIKVREMHYDAEQETISVLSCHIDNI